MRLGYWFFRYYKYRSGGKLVFNLFLIAIVLGFAVFFSRIAMMSFLTDKVKTEISKLQSVSKSYVPAVLDISSPEAVISSRIPKSCFSSDARGCVCYDQYTTVIKDFPVDRCRDIVNGFSRF